MTGRKSGPGKTPRHLSKGSHSKQSEKKNKTELANQVRLEKWSSKKTSKDKL